MCLITTEE